MRRDAVVDGWFSASEENAKPGEVVRRLHGERVELLIVDMDGTKQTQHHSHGVEQLVVVLEGSVVALIGGVSRELSQGDALVIPAGVSHCVYSSNSGGARVVEARMRE